MHKVKKNVQNAALFHKEEKRDLPKITNESIGREGYSNHPMCVCVCYHLRLQDFAIQASFSQTRRDVKGQN